MMARPRSPALALMSCQGRVRGLVVLWMVQVDGQPRYRDWQIEVSSRAPCVRPDFLGRTCNAHTPGALDLDGPQCDTIESSGRWEHGTGPEIPRQPKDRSRKKRQLRGFDRYHSKFLIPTGQTRDAPQHCEGKKACMCRRREVLEEPEGYADCGGAENAVDQHIETASYWLDARWLYAELFLLWCPCQAPAHAIK
ncbi:hypothetical protein GE21DRAFT_8138 [Neurospora crassa]|uniref:Questionable protein n=1 Tax=Neurospora crassa (strain ATCC 24698 / 74-OR23-1A / CBS 708.71 / DSM 1257 / FGSC 987) TaxID=367110 RepID=Q1K7L1_NEUCR|nr:hypothetical protein NCU04146 [Neurospora crassa OR74A]EAA32066.3 hypothetical protein NCU04146 [Neurospora crassa OR74A]KHE87376.1 hypothetical protein GE21DRAFT_8138 [Neurospora crassa]|eukprot:XP_961302.3 hypothetical protein NCU04146 [Neurospora crassa OR74A]